MKKTLRYVLLTALLFTAISKNATAQVTGLSGWNIFLDPGHSQNENVGVYGYSEAKKNLRVALNIKDLLVSTTDIDTVYLCRTTDQQQVSLTQRTDYANSVGAAWYHSIHSDAGSTTANSTLLLWGQLYDGTPDPPVGGEAMSAIMVPILTQGMRTTTRGSYGDCSFYGTCSPSFVGPYLHVNRTTTMPSELSEAGFHTNPVQNTRNMNAEWKRLEAKTMYWTFLQYHSLPRPFVGTAVGYIYNSENSVPVNGAVVQLNGETYTTDTYESLFHDYSTDPDQLHNGFYYFENLPDTTLEMIVSATGFYPDTLEVSVVDNFFTFNDVNLISNVAPVVEGSYPVDGDNAFPSNENIIIQFSRPMNTASVEANFSLDPATTGTFSWSDGDARLSFTMDSVVFETVYTLTISGAAVDLFGHELDGNHDGTGGDDFVLHFTSSAADVEPPAILEMYPANQTTGIELDPVLNLYFDEELAPGTVVPQRFNLERFSDHEPIDGALEHYVVNGQSALTYFINSNLDPSTVYLFEILPGLSDLFGNTITSTRGYRFTTGTTTYNFTSIDNFDANLESNWWQPTGSGSTTGIDPTGNSSRSANNQIVNVLNGSTTSMQADYAWDPNVTSWLIRLVYQGGASGSPVFTGNQRMQVYVFGDGSGNAFRFAVNDNWPTQTAANHEVSPWYIIDWIGWKLVTWNMATDGCGTWGGDGQLDGSLTFDSIQLTHFAGQPLTGAFIFDDMRLAVVQPNVDLADESDATTPTDFALYANYPNPFNASTVIPFYVPEAGMVALNVYNLRGEWVTALVNSTMDAGYHKAMFNPGELPSGMYLYQLRATNFQSTRKLTIVK